MTLFKRILKYLLFTILSVLLVTALIILGIYIRYQTTVSAKPAQLIVSEQPGEFGQFVNPFIGTGGFPTYTAADDIPGATVPFGMVRLSPDTKFFLGHLFGDEETVSTAGYYYGDNKIMGFSHTRLVGTGAYDGGHFRVIPTTGENGQKRYRQKEYSKFSHKNELAFPGYYAVKLPEQGVLAELTATAHVGLHRYTFTKAETPHILIDVSSALGHGKTTEGEVYISSEKQEITGCIRTFGSFASRYGGEKVYFCARFSLPFESFGVWNAGQFLKNQASTEGD
jgi:putative alpha-1,2-mannosidase